MLRGSGVRAMPHALAAGGLSVRKVGKLLGDTLLVVNSDRRAVSFSFF